MTFAYKMIIVVDTSLQMPKGKLAGQVAHAAVTCLLQEVLKGRLVRVYRWFITGQKKVICKPQVDFNTDLLELSKLASQSKASIITIEDFGKTAFNKPTVTCVGIGLIKNNNECFSKYKLL